jgi:hypothetical protein
MQFVGKSCRSHARQAHGAVREGGRLETVCLPVPFDDPIRGVSASDATIHPERRAHVPSPLSTAWHIGPSIVPLLSVPPRSSAPCCPPCRFRQPLHRFSSPIFVAHRVDQASPGCREGPIHPSGRRRDHSCVTSLSTFRHAIVRQHLPCMLSCHWSLQGSSVVQNDRVDNLATLHAALSGVGRQILAPLGDHESAAAWTTIRVVDSCPISIRHLNRLLLCHCQRCTH